MPQIDKPQRRPYDLREMLLAAGVGQFNALLSLPKMLLAARTTDPYDQGVMQLVQALQNVMNRKGAKLELTGFLNEATQRELARYAGPSWQDKSWAQLLGDVLDRTPPRPRPPMPAPKPRAGLGDAIADVFYSPVALVAVGMGAWFILRKKGR